MPLQRVIADFGADVPFGQIPQKLLEHHGVSVPISSAQSITQDHAQRMLETQCLKTQMAPGAAVDCLIAQMDGSLIPIVDTSPSKDESDTEKVDRRTTRKIGWREARLAEILHHSQ